MKVFGRNDRKKGKKGKHKRQNFFDANKGYPSYNDGKGKGGKDKGQSKTFTVAAEKSEEQPANQQSPLRAVMC